MTQPPGRHGNQPITLQQKQTLITVYQQTENMSRAMREANIRSPRTAYLWWRRFCEAGEAGLQPRSHARHTQKRLSQALAEQIIQLRRQNPGWGRRKIANALMLRYGRQVVSPGGVEVALRRAGLWERGAQPAAQTPQTFGVPAWLGKGVDVDLLLANVETGIRLSIRSDARAATDVLYQQIWRPLESNLSLWSRLLAATERGLGSWLLSSRLHLGHSLMNSGHWLQAARILRETMDWMREQPTEQRQRAWEDEPHFVTLRRDDVWLGCYHHLALVLGKSDVRVGLAYLQTALNATRLRHRPVTPGDKAMLGDLERDLAHLKLRLRRLPPEEEIRQHLLRAQQSAEEAGSRGTQAFTYLARAKLHHRLAREAGVRERGTRRQQRNLMEQAIDQALQLIDEEQEDRPMRQTLCFVDAAQLAHAHGAPVDGERIQRVAQYCLAYGYGHQAQHLLAIPGIHAWLSEEMRQNLAHLSQPGRKG